MAKIPGAVFPVDPTIPADAPDFRYEVIVTVRCGDASVDTPYAVETDDRISISEAVQQAIDGVRKEGANDNRNSPPPPSGDLEACVYTGRVVSVGRRTGVPAIPPRK